MSDTDLYIKTETCALVILQFKVKLANYPVQKIKVNFSLTGKILMFMENVKLFNYFKVKGNKLVRK